MRVLWNHKNRVWPLLSPVGMSQLEIGRRGGRARSRVIPRRNRAAHRLSIPRDMQNHSSLSAIYENGFSVKTRRLIPAPPVDEVAVPISPPLLVMRAGVGRAA